MGKMLNDIFDKVNCEIPNIDGAEQGIAIEVEVLLEALQEEVTPELYGQIEKTVWQVSFIAEKAGFELGAKYIARLLAECLS